MCEVSGKSLGSIPTQSMVGEMVHGANGVSASLHEWEPADEWEPRQYQRQLPASRPSPVNGTVCRHHVSLRTFSPS